MLAKGEVLQGRYRIIRQLGHGGMGAVYEAKDERLGSSVALKEIIVEIDRLQTEKQRNLFQRAFELEAKLLANLYHEVFPRVMDYFSEESRQFLIMELVFGDDLGETLHKNEKPFEVAKVMSWADHLLDALDYLHTQKHPIYHRDIKPQNLKVTERGKIKLLDFGIAKTVDQSGSTITNKTLIGATIDYAPIEQMLPALAPTFREFIILKHNEKATAILSQNTDARCDIYAVGATFYHLLTKRAPIDSAKRSLEIWEGNKDPLINPRELNADISPAISAWLLKALEVERDDRYSNALEMQKALQKAISEPDGKSSEKTLILAEPIVSTAENTQKLYNQNLSEAKTENLIETGQSQAKTEKKIIFGTKASFTQPSLTEPSVFQPTNESPITEILPIEVSNTQPAGSISNPELTAPSYFNEKLIEKKPQTVPMSVPFTATETKTGFNVFWLIPIFAIGLLAVGGIGGFVLLNSSNSTETTNSVSNITISTPNASPSVSSAGSAGISTSPEPTASNPVVRDENPKPTTAPTQNKPVVQTTVKPPVTSKPIPQKSNAPTKMSDDCVYNGRNCPKD